MAKIKIFFGKVKSWLIAHKPSKRRLIQVYAALLYNANIKGFFTGSIYRGNTKNLCVPGLNCYSCPGAIGACPLGALQNALATSGTTVPAYVFGIIILFGLLLGRAICGFLCPFGLIQELLYKIRTPKLKKSNVTRVLSYFKYVLLAILIAVPIIYTTVPAFCKYICPAGTLEGAVGLLSNAANADFYGMLGYLFSWKFCLLVVFIVASIFVYRFFCRFFCPLGAIYGLFCRISLLGIKLDKSKCVDCGACLTACKMDIKRVGDHECINCGDCIPACPTKAISWKGSQIFLKATSPAPVPVAAEGVPLSAMIEGIKPESLQNTANEGANGFNNVANGADNFENSADGAQAQSETATSCAITGAELVSEKRLSAKAQKKLLRRQKIKSVLKSRRFWLEFTAVFVAIAVLIAALVYYNIPEEKQDKINTYSLKTYSSAATAAGEDYVISADGENSDTYGGITVIYYWRTDWEDSHSAIDLLQSLYESYHGEINALAVHTSLTVLEEQSHDVQAFIDSKGWNALDVTFLQDTRELHSFEDFGGKAHGLTAIISADGTLSQVLTGELTEEALSDGVSKAMYSNVYKVGDKCPLFALSTYNSANAASGEQFSVWASRGKVTVINFWYTTCGPCVEELPDFNDIYTELLGTEKEINMVAVHSYMLIPAGGVQNWIDNEKGWGGYNILFAQDTDGDATFFMLGGKSAYPVTVIVDAEGIIRCVNQGKFAKADLLREIDNARVPYSA